MRQNEDQPDFSFYVIGNENPWSRDRTLLSFSSSNVGTLVGTANAHDVADLAFR